MADGAIIRFDKEHRLEVEETVDAVVEAIEAAADREAPLIELTQAHKSKAATRVVVNAVSIRTISPPTKFRSASFQ